MVSVHRAFSKLNKCPHCSFYLHEDNNEFYCRECNSKLNSIWAVNIKPDWFEFSPDMKYSIESSKTNGTFIRLEGNSKYLLKIEMYFHLTFPFIENANKFIQRSLKLALLI